MRKIRNFLDYVKYFNLIRERQNIGIVKSLTNKPKNNNYTKKFWIEHFGCEVTPFWHNVFNNYCGLCDHRWIPDNVWLRRIIPFFNHQAYKFAYKDKNLTEIFLKNLSSVVMPKTILKRMHGNYYDEKHLIVQPKTAFNLIKDFDSDLIIKKSDTDDGMGIKLLNIKNNLIYFGRKEYTFEELEKEYGNNFIVQEKVKQHRQLAAPHHSSLNTIRVLTFRWNGKILYLLAFLRIGVDNKITDNASTGGICCGINAEGILNHVGVDMFGNKYREHPTSGYVFNKRNQIPFFDKVIKCAKEIHKDIYHFDLISWDFAIDCNGRIILLEINYRGASWIYQLACEKPIFGNLTVDVLNRIKKKHSFLDKFLYKM